MSWILYLIGVLYLMKFSNDFIYKRMLKKNDLPLYKYVMKIEDVISICDRCEKDPDRFTGNQVHKRLYPTGTVLSSGIPNLECLMCGHKKEAKYEGKAC